MTRLPGPFPRLYPPARIGLLAAAGRFPITFAEAACRQGYSVCTVGVEDMCPPELEQYSESFKTFGVGRMGKAIRFFKRREVEHIVMAGKFEKTILFSQPWKLLQFLPDYRTMHMWLTYARENRKDDTLLLAVIREFERDGLKFGSALDYCPEILVQHGFLTKRKPTSAQWDDIRFGWELAKEMGRLDVGQTVVVNDMACIAIEAIEGTDKAIERAGELCRRGGFTVVKVAKPQQDMRFDVPTIGMQTIHSMAEAGGRVLAVETGMTIILDEPEVVALADKLGIAIVSVKAEELRLHAAA